MQSLPPKYECNKRLSLRLYPSLSSQLGIHPFRETESKTTIYIFFFGGGGAFKQTCPHSALGMCQNGWRLQSKKLHPTYAMVLLLLRKKPSMNVLLLNRFRVSPREARYFCFGCVSSCVDPVSPKIDAVLACWKLVSTCSPRPTRRAQQAKHMPKQTTNATFGGKTRTFRDPQTTLQQVEATP